MLNSIINENVTLSSELLCILVSLVSGIVIAFTHYKTSRKYSKNFLVTLASLPAIIQLIILMVNGNLGTAVAVGGTFSLIRFRSAPGTSKDLLSLIFAVAIGLATGMGYIYIAIAATVILSCAILIFSNTGLFDNKTKEKILVITVPEDLDYTSEFAAEFDKYTKKCELVKTKTVNMGSLFELTYYVTLRSDISEKNFLDDLRIKNSNLKINLSSEIVESDF